MTIAHLDKLPTLAPIAIKLLQLTADDKSNAAQVGQGLKADPALTAKLLSIANSASSGVRQEVTTVDRAVSLLGFRTVRNLVLALKVVEVFQQPGRKTTRFDRMEFWRHTLGVACAARRLAELRRELNIDLEEAFSAGLLHDLGKIALDAVFPKAYERIVERVDQEVGDIADVERALLGADHTEAGRRLAEKWNLPKMFCEVIWLHHLAADALPEHVCAPKMILLVQLADMLTREQGVGYSGNYLTNETAEEMGRRLGFTPQHIEAVGGVIDSDVKRQAEMLGLDLRETPEQSVSALNRANEELGKINAELIEETKSLGAGSRFFRAMVEFDRRLNLSSELADVVSATAEAALTALQRPCVAAFGFSGDNEIVEIKCAGATMGQTPGASQRVDLKQNGWLTKPWEKDPGAAVQACPELLELLSPVIKGLGSGTCWLLPIALDRQLRGGVVFAHADGDPEEVRNPSEELRSLLISLGLAMARANSQTEARRLAEDLAESNRRLQQMQTEVLRSRTLSIIAEMAAGAAHELNSPLVVISGRAQMLREQVSDPEHKRRLDVIDEKAHECSRIVSELMDFARPRPPALQAIELEAIVEQVRGEWPGLSGMPAARLVIQSPAGGPTRLVADGEQLRAVITELLRNAGDAIGGNNGTVRIEWRVVPTDSLPPSLTDKEADHHPGDWVEILVRDTGTGMSPAVRQRAFDPFFSHRAAGRGRGLGLSRVHRMIDAHGGRIQIDSRPGEGTTVQVLLPMAAIPPSSN